MSEQAGWTCSTCKRFVTDRPPGQDSPMHDPVAHLAHQRRANRIIRIGLAIAAAGLVLQAVGILVKALG